MCTTLVGLRGRILPELCYRDFAFPFWYSSHRQVSPAFTVQLVAAVVRFRRCACMICTVGARCRLLFTVGLLPQPSTAVRI